MATSTRQLEQVSFNLRLAAKRLEREIRECKAAETRRLTQVRAAIQTGDVEDAQIHASEAIRQCNRALALKRTLTQMGITNDHIKAAMRNSQFNRDMASVVRSLNALQTTMPAEKVIEIYERYEQHQDTLQITERALDEMTQRTTASLVPSEQVAELIGKVAAEHSLQLGERFSAALLKTPTAAPAASRRTDEGIPLLSSTAAAAAASSSSTTTTTTTAIATATITASERGAPAVADADIRDLEERLARLKTP